MISIVNLGGPWSNLILTAVARFFFQMQNYLLYNRLLHGNFHSAKSFGGSGVMETVKFFEGGVLKN